MKVAVFYNDDAGGTVGAGDIRRAIERHGHEVVTVVETQAGVSRVLDAGGDVIVAAGGDGTVASVAREMAGGEVPLAVLPLGTANNIALSLGCDGPLDAVIDHWSHARVRHMDLGRARGPWGERRFIEGVGGGLVTRSIAALDAQPLEPHPADHRIELALGGYLDVLSRLTPHPWSLRLDGAAIDGEFLLVEVLNIRSIGPNFMMARTADPFDGSFTVALARETEREALLSYWQARMAGEPCSLGVEVHNAATVILQAGDDLHVDDTLFAWPESGSVDLTIDAGVLPVLSGPFTG